MFSRVKKKLDFPLHYHEGIWTESNLNTKGAKRIVGDHSEIVDDLELVLSAQINIT